MAKHPAIGVVGNTSNASTWRILDETALVKMSMKIIQLMSTVADQHSNI